MVVSRITDSVSFKIYLHTIYLLIYLPILDLINEFLRCHIRYIFPTSLGEKSRRIIYFMKQDLPSPSLVVNPCFK